MLDAVPIEQWAIEAGGTMSTSSSSSHTAACIWSTSRTSRAIRSRPRDVVHGHVSTRYLAVAGWRPGDHVIVASNPGLIRKLVFDLPVPCNVHAGRGRDGADIMLLSPRRRELVARRYIAPRDRQR